ncbi:MAG: hypothetical protein L3K03_04340 [Thermoplasmata archaeon]|nr:hypothetical protein [Thermoplasmata archaeon]
MAEKVSGEPTPVVARNRCTCGHYPVDHLRVRAIRDIPGGSFELALDGPCRRCGESCAKFQSTS